MSFMGGSMCSTGSNPLAQMAKQQDMDRSHQYEQMKDRSSSGTMRQDTRQMSAADHRLMQNMDRGSPSAFQYGDIRAELGHMQNGHASPSGLQHAPAPGPQSAWSADFANYATAPSGNAGPSQWASEFGPQQAGPSTSQAGPSYSMPMSFMPRTGGMMYGGSSMLQSSAAHGEVASSSRITELDNAQWEEQFKSVEKSADPEAKAAEPVAATATAQDENITVEEILDEKEIGIEDGFDPKWFESEKYPPGWEDVWSRIKGDMADAVNTGARTHTEDFTRDFDEYAGSRPRFADYTFSEENQYTQEDDPFALGVALMDQGAKLSLAVLCFEAALQRDPNHVEAWSRLGAAQAQNEFEDHAIRALEQCIKLDPKNEVALMNLAVSYTNEGYENAAYATLERWLATKYPELASQAVGADPDLDRQALHAKVTGLFINAAQLSPDGANMDVDVQAGLGVLFYGNEEYTKAVDCFRAALSARPDDPLLWNRLGATLANSSRPEEAIDAYYKALELRPSFVRARYNVGVSCISIGCYREAAEHLLSAISLHQTEPGEPSNNSTNLCETLRRVFLAMDRRDLVSKVGPGMNLDELRREFKF